MSFFRPFDGYLATKKARVSVLLTRALSQKKFSLKKELRNIAVRLYRNKIGKGPFVWPVWPLATETL